MSTDRTRVLVVEDDARTAGQYVLWMPDHWSVAVVETGEAALSAVDPGTDVVVVGGEPSDQSAYRLLRRLRSRGYECQTLLVGMGDPDVGDHGADELLPTPVDEDSFRETLGRLADRVAYDERLKEYYSLVSKKAVMEARRSPSELEDSEDYARLVERTREMNDNLDEMLAGISETDDYGSVFRGFFPGQIAPE